MSNLKIVALAGFQDTGKTNILNKLIIDLDSRSGFSITEGKVGNIDKSGNYEDTYAVLEKGKEKIYINTSGDRLWQVVNNISEAKNKEATKLVIPCHVSTRDSQREILLNDEKAMILYKPDYPNIAVSERVYDLYVERLKSSLF